MYILFCQDYRCFPAQMFEAFSAQIPTFPEKTFRCFIFSRAITLEPICGSGFFPLGYPANAPLLNCRSWLGDFTLNQYSDPRFQILQSRGFQTLISYCHSGRLVLPFIRIEKSFFKITKFNFEIAISKTALVARIYRDFSVLWACCLGHILMSPRKFWQPKTTWNFSVLTQAWKVK